MSIKFLSDRTRWLDIYFLIAPVIMLVQWLVLDNLTGAWGLLGITLIMFIFRPMVRAAYPHRMGTMISRSNIERLNQGETITVTIFEHEITLTPEQNKESQ